MLKQTTLSLRKVTLYGCTTRRERRESPKLSRPWTGPYVVIKRINYLVYKIQQGLKSKLKVVHRNRLWRYKGHDPPEWMGTRYKGHDPPQWIGTEEPSHNWYRRTISQDHSVPTENGSSKDMIPRQSKRLRRPPERLAMKVTDITWVV